MASLSKYVAVTLTSLTLLAPTLVSISESTVAEPAYFDQNCRPNPKLPEDDRFIVFYKSEFIAKGQRYWLSAAQYQDGAGILCLSKPNFQQARRLKELALEFISSITKDPKTNGIFLVKVHEGNGPSAPTTVYRLDVTNPNKPIVRQQSTTRRSRS